MNDYLTSISFLFIYCIAGLLLSILTIRASRFLFGISLISEIKNGNKGATYFSIGIFILYGLIVGLIRT